MSIHRTGDRQAAGSVLLNRRRGYRLRQERACRFRPDPRLRSKASAVLCAFDLLELNGEDLRREPIQSRKHALMQLLSTPPSAVVFNHHYETDGERVWRAASKLGCEGIVSKRLGSLYRSGSSPHWVKVKNPNAPAVMREAEEDWGAVTRTHSTGAALSCSDGDAPPQPCSPSNARLQSPVWLGYTGLSL
jgi:ATP-dependent DNA ligase